MYTIEKLRALGSKSATAVRTMEAAIARLNATIERLEADATRSREYTLEAVQAERDRALPALSAELDVIREANKEAAPQLKFWDSRPLLMSLMPMDPDPAKDATIKAFRLASFEKMPGPLLQLVYENALFDGDLPLIWLAFSVGRARGTGDATLAAQLDMSLDGLTVPNQPEALALIATCASNLSHAEMIAAIATGLRVDPIRKMQVGRQQQASSRLVQAAT